MSAPAAQQNAISWDWPAVRVILTSLTAPSGAPRQETLAVFTDLLWAHAVPPTGWST
ncbi:MULTISPECIES: hypothetical protein [Streptomyces]|uniref:hypothetical protein n=1 Tax=Streptomyces TaxID=1883 RepID=UPI000AF32623|nr:MULTISPECIES: hypothetical protein [Streptomyces]